MFTCDICLVNTLVYSVGVLTIASKLVPVLLKIFKRKAKKVELLEKNHKKDVVYIYQFGGTPTASSTSPYCIKIEAFCRLHNLKFERRNTVTSRGQNNLLPFIELNGEAHYDSQIIIRRLTQIFNLNNYPDESSAAIGHAIDRMLDNHTFFHMLVARNCVIREVVACILAGQGIPSLLLPIVIRIGGRVLGNKSSTKADTAIGKFSDAEYKELLRNDLVQLQTILGRKKFLLGEEATAVDCTAMGQFGSMYFATPSARFYVHDLIDSSDFAPLKEYLERVKTRIFGDEFCD